MKLEHLVLTCILIVSQPLSAEQTYLSERESLEDAAFENDSFDGEWFFTMFFNESLLVMDLCDLRAEDLQKIGGDCDVGPMITIPDISAQGQSTFLDAVDAYQQVELELFDQWARDFVSLCETGLDRPDQIADQVSSIRESIFAMNLGFYDQVVSELDESDVNALAAYNRHMFGAVRPSLSESGRRIEETLAAKYPSEYLDGHVQECTDAVTNKDKPHKRFRREPTNKSCSTRIDRSMETTDDTVRVGSFNMMGNGCGAMEYIAQEPELPGDIEVLGD